MFLLTKRSRRIHLQKQLILCNLKEAYIKFKDQNSEKLLDFSKFTVMAKKCILAAETATLQRERERESVHTRLCYHSSECETYFSSKTYDLSEKQVKTYMTSVCPKLFVSSVGCYAGNVTCVQGRRT
jgi:hypothetical protein